MTWWKKQLAATTAETESVRAREESQEALSQVESLRPQVEEISSSLSRLNDVNHFTLRLAVAYGLPQGEYQP